MEWPGTLKAGFYLVAILQLSCHQGMVSAVSLPKCVDQDLAITTGKSLRLFIDGVQVTGLQFPDVPNKADTVLLPASAQVVAVSGKKAGEHGGFLGSSATFVTDGSWKCTNRFYEGWERVHFDDSKWKAAYVVGPNGLEPWQEVDGIRADAFWIRASSDGLRSNAEQDVYCRKNLADTCINTPKNRKCSGTGPTCITSCSGRADGNYQSCKGCHVYASCSNEILTDGIPCPHGSLSWDDNAKRCRIESSTCTTCNETPKPTSPTDRPCSGTGPTCITSCNGRADGNYQSCKGCNIYASCSNEILIDGIPCRHGSLSWDDNAKRCRLVSTTCGNCHETPPTDAPTAIPTDAPTVAPTEPINTRTRPHPEPTTTTTTTTTTAAPPTTATPEPTAAPTVPTNPPCSGTGPACITSCNDRADGYYQSCNGCDVFATCSNELLYDDRPCPAGLYWDDNLKRCEYNSATCQECSSRRMHR